jgi:hypothetical protein
MNVLFRLPSAARLAKLRAGRRGWLGSDPAETPALAPSTIVPAPFERLRQVLRQT